MSDCPHHPGLKRPSAIFSPNARPEDYGAVVTTLMIRPEDCVQCALERITTLRRALLDVCCLASELRQHPCPITAGEASKRLTDALKAHMDDARDWRLP